MVEDVVEVVAKYGTCDVSAIRAGGIRRNRQGEGDIWVRCPWNSANELGKIRKIKIGCVGARVDLMEPPPLQCFRCWEYGHMKAQCRNSRYRANSCYRCGREGHRAAQCSESPSCILCKEKG